MDSSPAERALHIDARKTIYEKLHPKTKKGAAPGAGRGKGKKHLEESHDETLPTTFIDNTAKKTGKSRATVARDGKRGKGGKDCLNPGCLGSHLARPTNRDSFRQSCFGAMGRRPDAEDRQSRKSAKASS